MQKYITLPWENRNELLPHQQILPYFYLKRDCASREIFVFLSVCFGHGIILVISNFPLQGHLRFTDILYFVFYKSFSMLFLTKDLGRRTTGAGSMTTECAPTESPHIGLLPQFYLMLGRTQTIKNQVIQLTSSEQELQILGTIHTNKQHTV